jgi:hypothetical protein
VQFVAQDGIEQKINDKIAERQALLMDANRKSFTKQEFLARVQQLVDEENALRAQNKAIQDANMAEYNAIKEENKRRFEEARARFDVRLEALREARNYLLRECDWTHVSDSKLTAVKKAQWTEYRQALRDITNNLNTVADIERVVLPTPPA